MRENGNEVREDKGTKTISSL